MSIGARLGESLEVLGGCLAVGLGGYLLVIGPEITYVTPDGAVSAVHEPSLAGLVPLTIGAVAFWGVLRHRIVGVWAAAALAVAAAVAYLFGFSLQFALVAAVLLIGATLSTLSGDRAADTATPS